MWRMTDTHVCAFLQLKAHKRGIEETEVTINMLLKRQNEDKVHSLPCFHHSLCPQDSTTVSVTNSMKSMKKRKR